MTTKGWKEEDFIEIAEIISQVLKSYKDIVDDEDIDASIIKEKYANKVYELVHKER